MCAWCQWRGRSSAAGRELLLPPVTITGVQGGALVA